MIKLSETLEKYLVCKKAPLSVSVFCELYTLCNIKYPGPICFQQTKDQSPVSDPNWAQRNLSGNTCVEKLFNISKIVHQ